MDVFEGYKVVVPAPSPHVYNVILNVENISISTLELLSKIFLDYISPLQDC